jgi:hypothetical protein
MKVDEIALIPHGTLEHEAATIQASGLLVSYFYDIREEPRDS